MNDIVDSTKPMSYLCKFDSEGNRTETFLGCEYSNEQKAEMLSNGYVEISEEEWNYYVGNNGQGDNGTGYIRDVVTGKPVSAPPIPKEVVERNEAVSRIAELKQKLSGTDYVVTKIAEGAATKEEYADILANRKLWREEINELEKVVG